jgi:dTMP kinase
MFAARAAHLDERILPAIAAGTWVVSDRFVDASYAYQSAGRGLPESDVASLERIVMGGVQPDLVLVFDLDVAEGLRRAHARGDTNRFETERVEFFERARSCYLQRAKRAPERYAVLDAAQPVGHVRGQIHAALKPLLSEPA